MTAPRTTPPAEGDPIGDIRIPVIGLNQAGFGDTLHWGFVTAFVVAGIFHRPTAADGKRRVIYGVAALGTLMLLWFFFGTISRLPASF